MKDIDNKLTLDVRLASIDDGETIVKLWQDSARWLLSKGINQWRPEYFNVSQVKDWIDHNAEIYLASLNNEIVGTLLICWSDPSVWGELDDDDSGYIHRFAISRNHVGSGIGESFLKWAENYIRLSGKSKVRLDCMAANDKLNQYYQRNGYQYVKTTADETWRANLYEK
ncbi:GNAT superfamily N-acetyltransferase [Paenibacillus castaneae]|uniref:GNAT family N-acetyltransferase n=1 Tax=Paenibacillus castaneae TaxID=474957 RepID=UPI000C9B3E0C|nr:GNAT family N-acetyltransferase [Paenibacillus castaneae]NIK80029.1 GNAT superfamily N-acetyltransferase [Paenibacillus castaneae]